MDKFYITTSIAYTNAFPHIGFALESIQADVLARYNRSLNKDVFFLTGTDEHGIKIAQSAEKEEKTPEEFSSEISKKFQLLKKTLNLSNDDFIRTSDKKRHLPVVRKIWDELKENGDIYKKKYKGLYCSGCEAFLAKRDLVDGKCPIHLKKPDTVEEENYFFRLTKYIPQIKDLIERKELEIIPDSRKNETLGIIEQDIEDVSFSRPKEKYWGFPVPDDETQVIYVWADALTNYISALGYPDGEKFKKYWPADIHCIGKDILKFHALIWPAMLLSLKLPLPKKIFVHGFITVDNQKMSKSLGNVINPFELVDKYGIDAVRYYLLREISSTEDGDFSYEKFEERYNADLSKGIGNLVSRVRAMGEEIDFKDVSSDEKISSTIRSDFDKAMEEFKFNDALKTIWDLISYCDKYINTWKPWEKKDGYEKRIKHLIDCLGEDIASLLEPFLPETSEKIIKAIDIDKKTGRFKNKKGEALFPRI